jgi:MtN3 and saliva related transmembrane protein
MTSQIVINVVGAAAAACSMASFVPQAVKIVREHDASSVSTRMYAVTVVGFALWSTYGVLLQSWPLVGSNLVSLSLASLILVLKFRYPKISAAPKAAAGSEAL